MQLKVEIKLMFAHVNDIPVTCMCYVHVHVCKSHLTLEGTQCVGGHLQNGHFHELSPVVQPQLYLAFRLEALGRLANQMPRGYRRIPHSPGR